MKNIYRLIAFMVFCAAIKYLDIRITDGAGDIIMGIIFIDILIVALLYIASIDMRGVNYEYGNNHRYGFNEYGLFDYIRRRRR